jgi:DNA-directed RNA polymerase specialized sigma24 family protein
LRFDKKVKKKFFFFAARSGCGYPQAAFFEGKESPMIESSSLPARPYGDLVMLVRRAQDGCEKSACVLFERYREPLLAVIRRVIGRPLRRLYDSDDFLLSTFKEIFTKHFRDEVLCDPQTLWPYLKRIAENKVRDAERRFLLSERHKLDRDVPLANLNRHGETLPSKELSPQEEAVLRELVEERLQNLIRQLPSLLQDIVALLLEGNSGLEIAVELGIEPKRVYRAIDWLNRKVLEKDPV